MAFESSAYAISTAWRSCLVKRSNTAERIRLRRLLPCAPVGTARFHHDLDAGVVFVPEGAVHRRRIFQADAMRDDERGIDLAALDALEQPGHVLVHVGLTHLQRQTFGEGGSER